jgi:hypothetical protein
VTTEQSIEEQVLEALRRRGKRVTLEYPGVVCIHQGDHTYWTSSRVNPTWTVDKLDPSGDYVDTYDTGWDSSITSSSARSAIQDNPGAIADAILAVIPKVEFVTTVSTEWTARHQTQGQANALINTLSNGLEESRRMGIDQKMHIEVKEVELV